jgi:hypothetical protein
MFSEKESLAYHHDGVRTDSLAAIISVNSKRRQNMARFRHTPIQETPKTQTDEITRDQ